jgi:hypothetical protein
MHLFGPGFASEVIVLRGSVTQRIGELHADSPVISRMVSDLPVALTEVSPGTCKSTAGVD